LHKGANQVSCRRRRVIPSRLRDPAQPEHRSHPACRLGAPSSQGHSPPGGGTWTPGVHNNGGSVSLPGSLLLSLMSLPDLEEEPYSMMTSLSAV
ncbi:hypothetical protein LEMLEM_LOCUS8342, partial [Lemmus lemmus]